MTQSPHPIMNKKQSSERLFIVIGILWLILGAVILSQTRRIGNQIITWSTETERDNVGFNVYRAVRAENISCEEIDLNEYVQINDELIPARGTTETGHDYSFEDKNTEKGKRYCYRLEDIERSGKGEKHEPIEGKENQIEQNLFMVLAPLCFVVELGLIVSGFRSDKKL